MTLSLVFHLLVIPDCTKGHAFNVTRGKISKKHIFTINASSSHCDIDLLPLFSVDSRVVLRFNRSGNKHSYITSCLWFRFGRAPSQENGVGSIDFIRISLGAGNDVTFHRRYLKSFSQVSIDLLFLKYTYTYIRKNYNNFIRLHRL